MVVIQFLGDRFHASSTQNGAVVSGPLWFTSSRQVLFPFHKYPRLISTSALLPQEHFPPGMPTCSTYFSVCHLKVVLFIIPPPHLTLMKNMAFLEVNVASFVMIGNKIGGRVSILIWEGIEGSVFSLIPSPHMLICPTLGNHYLIAIKILIICCFRWCTTYFVCYQSFCQLDFKYSEDKETWLIPLYNAQC